MTLEQVANIGNIAAAIAVVVSLVYVARQLNQNTAMLRASAAGERVQRDFDIIAPILESREIAELWAKGGDDFAGLDAVDRQRLIFFERRAFVHWHNMFSLYEQRLVSDADWRDLQWIMRTVGRRQSVQEAWRVFGGGFSAGFREVVNEVFKTGDAGPA